MNDGAETPELPSLDIVCSHAERQLDLQWQLWDSVDNRLRLLLGFVGILFAATLAFADRTNGLATSTKVLLVVAVVAMFGAGVVATLAWLPRRFDRPPEPLALRNEYLTTAPTDTKLAVLDTMVTAYHENETQIFEKLAAFRRAALALGVGVAMIGFASIIEVVR